MAILPSPSSTGDDNQNGLDEETPLIASSSTAENSTSSSPEIGNVNSSSTSTSSLEDENEKLWPATFERSISLLAGPQMDSKAVDFMTRSPKVVPPHLAQARVSFLSVDLFTLLICYINLHLTSYIYLLFLMNIESMDEI